MTNIPHEPRSRTVLRYTRMAHQAGVLNVFQFSQAVSAGYLARTQPEDRALRFREDGDSAESLGKAVKHNWQLVDRLIKGTSREFHADLEEVWVEMLPEPYRTDCKRELTRRYGFAAVTPLADCNAVVSEGLPGLAREFADTMQALAPILADGRIDEHDAPLIRAALKEGTDLIAQWAAIQAQLVVALPQGQVHGAAVLPLRRADHG